jgi:hypothetical protein
MVIVKAIAAAVARIAVAVMASNPCEKIDLIDVSISSCEHLRLAACPGGKRARCCVGDALRT